MRSAVPGGGFFMTVELPFAFDKAAMHICAERYGVICCPMTLFSLEHSSPRQIRLSFSYVSIEEIDRGIAQLAQFVRERVAAGQGK